MSFFNGIEVSDTFESAPVIDVIPEGTSCLAMIDEIGWTEFQGDEYINARWTVIEPAIYKNRKIFQKIKVHENDEAKANKAKRMLLAIDANAGGKLAASGEEPTDSALARALMSKPMIIKINVWEMNDRKGNWIAAVSPRKSTPKPAPKQELPDEDVFI
jgi:hypothetical protein